MPSQVVLQNLPVWSQASDTILLFHGVEPTLSLPSFFQNASALLCERPLRPEKGLREIFPVPIKLMKAIRLRISRDERKSESKKMKKRIPAEVDQFQVMADSVPVLMWRSGPDQSRGYFNKTWLAFTGRTVEDERGEGWAQGIHPEDYHQCLEAYRVACGNQEPFSREYRLRHVSGEFRWVWEVGVPVVGSDGDLLGYCGTCTDITHWKKSELKLAEVQKGEHLEELIESRTKALAHAKNAAESANHAKSQFLANMSHELRTPMHAILSFASLGIEKLDHVPRDKMMNYLIQIKDSGKRLLALVNELLDLAKLESGRMILQIRCTDLRRVLEDVGGQVEGLLKNKNQTLHIEATEISTHVDCDESRLSQVLLNLLSNAIKFTPTGKSIVVHFSEAIVSVGRRVTDSDQVAGLQVTVRDHGLGIPKGEYKKIFDKFFQSRHSQVGTGGTGLGLAICQEIVAAHGGRIWAENHQSGGAILNFILPYHYVSPGKGEDGTRAVL